MWSANWRQPKRKNLRLVPTAQESGLSRVTWTHRRNVLRVYGKYHSRRESRLRRGDVPPVWQRGVIFMLGPAITAERGRRHESGFRTRSPSIAVTYLQWEIKMGCCAAEATYFHGLLDAAAHSFIIQWAISYGTAKVGAWEKRENCSVPLRDRRGNWVFRNLVGLIDIMIKNFDQCKKVVSSELHNVCKRVNSNSFYCFICIYENTM